MSKNLKRILAILISLVLLCFIGFQLLKYNTKKHSPEITITHTMGDTSFSVYYNRPFKKGRTIFGDLVPYNEVWRTGANEPTTFTTSKAILIDGSELPAGTYSLWTIPNAKSWKIIFNSKTYGWGVNFGGKVSHDPTFDALVIEVPIQRLLNIVEQFSIYFEDTAAITYLYLAWDTTAVTIPIKNI